MRTSIAIGAAIALSWSMPATAHVVFEKSTAPAGQLIHGKLVVGHGCGHSPTVKLRLKAPDGVLLKVAQPAAGWTVSTAPRPAAEAFSYGGKRGSEEIGEVIWTGKLENHAHGSFPIDFTVADQMKQGQKLFFPVIQECQEGAQRWVGTEEGDEAPAPQLTVGSGS